MPLTKSERQLRSNAHAALEAIKKVHAAGRRPHLLDSIGDEPFQSKWIAAVKKAHAHTVHVADHRMLSARELTKAFAGGVGNLEVNLDEVILPLRKRELRKLHAEGHRLVTAGRYEYEFDGNGIVVSKRLRKSPALNAVGTKPPESSNSVWNDVHADTGAANNWRDQPAPSQRTTLVGGQPIGTPPMTDRDAAVAAIKRALSKPKRWGQRDEDDMDEDESRAKDPNSADAFDTNPNAKRKRRADEDDDE